MKLSVGSHGLLISSLEQTMVDLVTDLQLLREEHDLARLFACLPYDLGHLFKLARLAGETSLRRVVFWALHAGRACWDDIPQDLSRSPTKLFPEHDPSSFIWEGRLRLFFPPEVLRWRPWPVVPDNDLRRQEWRELLNYSPFQTWQIENGWLAICEDPRDESLQCREAFFCAESNKTIIKQPMELLVDLFGHDISEPPSAGFPRLLLSWISSRADFSRIWETEILYQARKLMQSDVPRQLEAGLYHACKLGFLEEALETIANNGQILFQVGRLHSIALACKTALEKGKPLPVEARCLYARILARSFQFKKALEVIEEVAPRGGVHDGAYTPKVPGKARFIGVNRRKPQVVADSAGDGTRFSGEMQGEQRPRLTLIERGQLAYTAGVIHQQNSSFSGAFKELTEAQRCFSDAGDSHRGVKVLTALGNLHVSQGSFSEARKYYLTGISQLKKSGSEDYLAMLVNNLGFVEFKAGRFERAARLLSRSRTMYQDKGNPLVEATSLITQGKAMLGSGNIPKAFRLFHEAYSSQLRHPGSGYSGETAALIALSCELLGRQATAQPWWNLTPKANDAGVPPSSAVMINILRILSGLLAGKPETVRMHLEPLSLLAEKLSLPPDETAFHEYLHGMIEFSNGSDKAHGLFRSAMRNLVPTTNTCLNSQIAIMEFLSAPSATSRKHVENALNRLVTDQFYDPLWFCYAHRLVGLKIPQAEIFLYRQLQKTPIALLDGLSTRVPELKKNLKRLCRIKGSASLLTLIRGGRPKAFSLGEYERWKNERNTGCLRFAGPAGELWFSGRKAYLRPGSHPHGIITQLLLAYPDELSLSTLYRSVWGGEYDPECDAGALKTTLTRLRKTLESVTSAIRLTWGKRRQHPDSLFLRIDCSWECVI
ncbi:MAG: tetratricopeptide repeat protein [Candidatus Ozemobacteraceae bacterium]